MATPLAFPASPEQKKKMHATPLGNERLFIGVLVIFNIKEHNNDVTNPYSKLRFRKKDLNLLRLAIFYQFVNIQPFLLYRLFDQFR